MAPHFFLWLKTLMPYVKKIGEWPFQWKTNFNPDPAKQKQELIFLSQGAND